MNYLAHLALSQPSVESHVGNLLGDFMRGIDKNKLNHQVALGLENHLLVDKFTDRSEVNLAAKRLFRKEWRRFSPIILDVLYDYFLIKHWDLFYDVPFHQFKQESYSKLSNGMTYMPSAMRKKVSIMIEQDWFDTYSRLNGIAQALDNIAAKIRFSNNFQGSIEDIEGHYEELEHSFLTFYPLLMQSVIQHQIESSHSF